MSGRSIAKEYVKILKSYDIPNCEEIVSYWIDRAVNNKSTNTKSKINQFNNSELDQMGMYNKPIIDGILRACGPYFMDKKKTEKGLTIEKLKNNLLEAH